MVCLSCGGDDDGSMGADAGQADSGPVCEASSECDDGVFCNGEETCDPDDSDADRNGCVAGDPPCAEMDDCDEAAGICDEGPCANQADADGDGEPSIECGGADCDDNDANRYPGATEVCDPDNRDEDCDPTTFGFRDADGDSSPDAACCNEDSAGNLNCGDDCNDLRPNVNVSASEVCDGFDNDCDTNIDEGVVQTFYIDADGDTYGNESGATVEACFAPDGYAEMGRDCDDGNADRNPGRPELCDEGGVDENCDGESNPASLCSCSGDISRMCIQPGICEAGTERCVAGSWGSCSIAPVGETCNTFDDDCDGTTDEGLAITCYIDADDDGYPGSDPTPYMHCPQPGRADVGGCPVTFTDVPPFGADIDCNDADEDINPGAVEICDAAMVDENCDDVANPNPPCECSGSGTESCPMPGICADGTRTCVDGQWTDCTIEAETETCNGDDDDCDGTTDEGNLCGGPNSYQGCREGVCRILACEDGYGDCDRMLGNGCEQNIDTSDAACGRCGVSCLAGAGCNSGVCGSPVGIAASYKSTCIVWSGGTVSCWGNNTNGQLGNGNQNPSPRPVAVMGLTDAVSIAGGASHFCAIREDQTVVCWGDNSELQSGQPSGPRVMTPTAVAGVSGAVELIGGYGHTCARTASAVLCWGDNQYGQLGDGTFSDSSSPVTVTGLTNATNLGGGPSHVCARRSDSTVVCWGRNGDGQLGNGNTDNQGSPAVTMWTDVTDIGGGGQLDSFTCARHSDGTISCAGSSGPHMGNDAAGGSTPVTMTGATSMASASDCGGSGFNCFIMNDQSVECVGSNGGSGSLGRGDPVGGTSNVLAPVMGASGVIQLVTGLDHSCVLTDDELVYCWGDNDDGQLGDGSMSTRTTASLMPGIRQMSSVGTFERVSCATRSDGNAYCWGSDTQGSLGNGPGAITQQRPDQVSNIDDASMIAVGRYFSCVRHQDATVSCWGINAEGQLGIGPAPSQEAPMSVPGLTNVRELAAGYRHSCARMEDGTVKCWGSTTIGLGDGVNNTSDVPVDVVGISTAAQISVGTSRACARLQDGSVECWGSTPSPVNGISDAVDLGVFANHSCVVRPDGTLLCWGQNGSGQLGIGHTDPASGPVQVSGILDAVAVQGGNNFSCALSSDGTVRCWGENNEGQLGDASNDMASSPVMTAIRDGWSLGMGFRNACAIVEDGLQCWGDNQSGQLGNADNMDSNVPVMVLDLP